LVFGHLTNIRRGPASAIRFHDNDLVRTGAAKGDAFSKCRDFGAWLGVVLRQISTGDRTILGKISKRGNRYSRRHSINSSAVARSVAAA